MDSMIFWTLVVDGVVNGAIYALLAIGLVLVFVVTRVILLPQGVYMSFAALTLSQFQRGNVPGTAGLLLALGLAAFVIDLLRSRVTRAWLMRRVASDLALPAIMYALVTWLVPLRPNMAIQIVLTLALITPLGPYLYRLAFQPLEQASVLTLLIASVGVHIALTVLGLVFFGPEGFLANPLSSAHFEAAGIVISGQSAIMVAVSLVIMVLLWLLFDRTLIGKAMRAVAVNRVGARLVGIPISQAGEITFALASFIGAVSGVLIAPVSMVYYDTGFLIGLIGFVAAIIGGMGSYPLAVAGAIFVGLLQSFAAFWNSNYQQVVVFTTLIPILLLRSLRAPAVEEDE
ncbi:branched-chain amino acid ABC transporter permease [Bradyrhizobium niftali]|jgi:branched-chain amino acid transport system permease protein|uniref:Branched-chain amino acid ABC transporter permease n=1 Tax=Bradyrhizobium niftali TaxID=2560055 RepID=A0A4Y9M7S8_9BRAD|nr:branched-chain amino acid ABC transporter permease [Bradyrhizobium niftali]TFV51249.1 branched-chain amino acid ABC transporter permease [Bradyrhizobium niftali]